MVAATLVSYQRQMRGRGGERADGASIGLMTHRLNRSEEKTLLALTVLMMLPGSGEGLASSITWRTLLQNGNQSARLEMHCDTNLGVTHAQALLTTHYGSTRNTHVPLRAINMPRGLFGASSH